MIPAADRWGPFRPDLDPAERMACLRCLCAVVYFLARYMKWRRGTAAQAPSVRLDTHALCARFSRLSHSGSVPKRHSYRGRCGVDGKRPILSVVVWAVFTRTQPCVEVIREAHIHPRPQHICGGMIVVFENPGLFRGFAYVNTCLFFFDHGSASSLIFAAKKELDNPGDQPTDDVHWSILSEQRWTRPAVEDNAAQRASDPEVLSFPAEQRARLRSQRQTAALGPACRTLDALAASDRRQVLASYAALARPAA